MISSRLPLAPQQALPHNPSAYTLEHAGEAPFPLFKFEALQHSHTTQVLAFIRSQLGAARDIVTARPLLPVLYGTDNVPQV